MGRTNDTEMDVKGLQEGHAYDFRVKAINDEGESEPLETEGTTIAKNPYDPPGKPGTPSIEDWDTDRVTLKWTAPKNNGGAPITSYIIEKKEKFSTSWDQILETHVIINLLTILLFNILQKLIIQLSFTASCLSCYAHQVPCKH